VSGLSVWRCLDCGGRLFPRRELCPRCGSRAFAEERVDEGVASARTTHRGVDIVSVRVGDDVMLLARAEGAIEPGSEVELRLDDGAPVAVYARRDAPT
jgi:hypothetical protein